VYQFGGPEKLVTERQKPFPTVLLSEDSPPPTPIVPYWSLGVVFRFALDLISLLFLIRPGFLFLFRLMTRGASMKRMQARRALSSAYKPFGSPTLLLLDPKSHPKQAHPLPSQFFRIFRLEAPFQDPLLFFFFSCYPRPSDFLPDDYMLRPRGIFPKEQFFFEECLSFFYFPVSLP